MSLDREHMIEVAADAAHFMTQNGICANGDVCFSLNAEGEPYHIERKIFSACFLCLGCGFIGGLASNDALVQTAITLFRWIINVSILLNLQTYYP
jgi:hypothetical protein